MMMAMCLAEVINSRDVAQIFDVSHDLVLAEVEDRRASPAPPNTIYWNCLDEHCQPCIKMNRTALRWLVRLWPIPQVAEFEARERANEQAKKDGNFTIE